MTYAPMNHNAAIAWLEEAARYFANRDTGGEDRAMWSNVYNAENATKIAALIRVAAPTGDSPLSYAPAVDPMSDPRVVEMRRVLEIVADGDSKDYTDNCDLARAALEAIAKKSWTSTTPPSNAALDKPKEQE